MPEVITQSAQETRKLGEILGEEIKRQRQRQRQRAIVIGLEGELGSGKTVFIQGLAKGLGIKDRIASPTFVIIRRHKIKVTGYRLQVTSFYHIDCYRLQRAKELVDLGLKEIIQQPENIIAIEWAERIQPVLPKNIIWLKFEHLEKEKRKILFKYLNPKS